MKKKLFFRRAALALLCLALTAACLPQSARAAEHENCSLQLSYTPGEQPMAGMTFRIYRVADVDTESITYHPTEVYAAYHVLNASGSWLSRAATLAGYVARDDLPADREGSTDADGNVRFDNLPSGLYLITGTPASRDGYRYTPTPFLISLPHTEDGYNWADQVSTHMKYSYTSPGDNPSPEERHVIKVWENEGNEEPHPDQVTVDLLRDGAVYDTVVLSSDSDWRYHWANLPGGSDYQVVERSPGEDYAVSVTQTGITSVITNTYTEDLDDKDPPLIDKPDPDPGDVEIEDPDPPLINLPQTGLLWWPVPVLAIAGFMLLFLGIVRHRRGAYEEEE